MYRFTIRIEIAGSTYEYYTDEYPPAAVLLATFVVAKAAMHGKIIEQKTGKTLSEF